MVEMQKGRLAPSDRIALAVGIFAFAGALGAVALEHAYPDANPLVWRGILFACVVLGVGAVTFLIFDLAIWPRWPVQFGRRVKAVLGVAILCSIFGGILIASHWPISLETSQTQPVPSSPEPPPQTWLTPNEILQLQTMGRTPVNYSPQELFDMYAKGNDTAAFNKNWIKIDYPLARPVTIDGSAYAFMFDLKPAPFRTGEVKAYFDQKRWNSRALLIRPGQQVRGFCQYMGFDNTEVVKGFLFKDTLVADNCEFE